jgi:hypothetical protein
MLDRTLAVIALSGFVGAATPVVAFAQSAAQPSLQDRWPAPTQQLEQRTPAPSPAPAPAADEPPPTQAETPAAAPAATPAPSPGKPAAATRAEKPAQGKPSAQDSKPSAQAAARSVACSGLFGRNSTHFDLAKAFNFKNVTFAEVEGGPDGSKLMATVLFPTDLKRRLEVLWQNEEARTDIHRVVINGQSTWTGPKGLRLGLTVAAVEKINGKPFTLQGFDQNNVAAATDWQGGALANIPGGCSIGVFFTGDPKAPESARAEAGGKEFSSSDAAMRALKPTVTEILFGYQE